MPMTSQSSAWCAVALLLTALVSAGETEHTGQQRPSANDQVLQAWLRNMVWYHRYSTDEIQQVTGLEASEIKQRLDEFGISPATRPPRPSGQLLVLPYPGEGTRGSDFWTGAVDPQRETKLSVFCPWDDASYVVLDVPEAIWSNLGLTYLAHTHIPTIWDKQNLRLARQEWQTGDDSSFRMERILPNGIVFGTLVVPQKDHLQMDMWLRNGTAETLSDLRVQNCVMLKGAAGFQQQTNDNKQFPDGYAVASSPAQDRWIITAWDPVHRAWGNAQCPCLHSDPKFPDCPPGETRNLRGWMSFYQGTDIRAELDRIEKTGWRSRPFAE